MDKSSSVTPNEDNSPNTDNVNTTYASPKNTTRKEPKRLSLTPFAFGRHPSAIHLAEILSGAQPPLDDFNVQHEFSGVNVTPVSSTQNGGDNPSQYKLSLSEVEHEICVDSNNFYIKQEIIKESKFKPELTKGKRHSMMTPKEEELDKEITKFIAEGKHYSHIEEKLSSLLKNKDDNNNGK